MFCPECGSKNVDEAVFCENCGSRIIQDNSQQIKQNNSNQFKATAAESTPTQSTQAQSTPTQFTPMQSTQSTPTQLTPTQFTPTPRKPMSKKSKITLAVAILVFAVVTIFYQTGKYLSNPERIASKYFVDVMSNNWEEVYGSYEVPESEFLSKKNFLDLKEKEKKKETLADYKVTSNSNETFNSNESEKDKGLIKSVNIEYRLKGDSGTNNYEVKLIKQKGKKLLFFDKWKISPDDMIISDYTIYVPKDIQVTIDKVKLSKTYLKPSDDESMDTYIIDSIFAGEHKIKLNHEIMKDYEETISIYEGANEFYYDTIELKDEVQESLANKSIDILENLYTSAIDEKNYSDITNSISIDADAQADIESVYNNLTSSIKDDSDTGLQNITFDNFNYTVEYSNYEGFPQVTVYLNYDYQYEYTEADWWTGDIASYTGDGSGNTSYDFKYVDGEWKLYYTDLYPIYY